MFFSANELIFGRSYADWTAQWWKSFTYHDFRRKMSPVFCVPGKMIKMPDRFKTQFKIPRDKAILFSVVNWLQPDVVEELESCQSLLSLAKKQMDDVYPEALMLAIDDKKLEQNNICRLAAEFKQYDKKFASDGFWVFLKPESLSNGIHHVNSFGRCASGKIRVEMAYEINIC